MEIKENVYENGTQTEDVAMAKEVAVRDQKGEERASAVLGKFKDVDALARAYSALEAEFTRRSQRLKQLEKKAENSERVAECSGAEKLREIAAVRKAESEEFDQFLMEVETARSETQEEPAGAVEPEKDGEEQSAEGFVESMRDVGGDGAASVAESEQAEKAGLSGTEGVNAEGVLSSVEQKERTEISAEELFAKACQNEEVRLKIIGEYLSSIGKTGAPVTAGRGGVMMTPPLRARSIDDAGNMALRYFKKGPQKE
ncbi:MAG: hypothetical protein J6D30_06025 [Clostridia bacterium]|nr:hypothetical protein [Clostridia bacterium]